MKIAIVTGVSSGIGEAVARLLLEDNWKVYGLSRSKPSIQGDTFIWLECDLAKSDSIITTLASVAEATIDLVVSNAGVAFKELATAATKESYDRMFSVNVLAPMMLINGIKGKIAKATIISVSSVSDRLVEKDFALYCSSKAANTRYFEALADELDQARVFCLLPDYVDTPMLRKQEAADFNWAGAIKVGDLADFAVSLCEGRTKLGSAANIIVVTDSLKEDLEGRERLYGFNTDTRELTKL